MHTVERHRKKITDDGIVDAKIPNDFIRASEMKTYVVGRTGNMRLKGECIHFLRVWQKKNRGRR